MITLEKSVVCDICGNKKVFEELEMSIESAKQLDKGWREELIYRFLDWIHLYSIPVSYILDKHYSDFCSVDCLKAFINKIEFQREIIEKKLILSLPRQEIEKNPENSNKTPHKECSCPRIEQVPDYFVKNLDQLYHPPQDELKNPKKSQ